MAIYIIILSKKVILFLQPNIICRTLTLPLGVLAGIGRKVSSFIFGVVPTQTTEMVSSLFFFIIRVTI